MDVSYRRLLTFKEVAKYLARYGYEYDLDNKDDCNKLRGIILALCSDYILRATFYYSGAALIDKAKFKDQKTVKYISTKKDNISGDFIVEYDSLVKLLKTSEPIYLDGQTFNIFTAMGIDDLPAMSDTQDKASETNGYFFSVRIEGEINSPVIKINDLRYSRADIDEAINIGFLGKIPNNEQTDEPNQQLIDAQEQIDDLTKKLKVTEKELAAAKINCNEPIDERSEKSYQNTIGLLLEVMTSPRAEGGQAPFPSESDIIARVNVKEKSVYGQGKSKLEERFRDAKLILADTRKKP